MKAFIREFKTFLNRGNVLDLAVGVIIGGAFKSITDSLTNDILMPLLGILVNRVSFADLSLKKLRFIRQKVYVRWRWWLRPPLQAPFQCGVRPPRR